MHQLPFTNLVTSEVALREIIGYPGDIPRQKQLSTLDEHCQNFISHSPFLLISSANKQGECDVSPRGDVKGSVLVLDERTLIIPDRPGNRRVDTLCNILSNPNVGLLFMIPGVRETLRVNGKAGIFRDDDILQRLVVQGKKPLLAIGIQVEQAFLHCAKAIIRSHLWEPSQWSDPSDLPSASQILLSHTKLTNRTVEDIEQLLEDDRATRLY